MANGHERKVLLGEAAEHLVLARLLRRGYVASQAPRTWRADDILVYGGPRVQVKATIRGIKVGWVVTDVEVADDRFYALVDFSDEGAPVIYVLPSVEVRRAAETFHAAWLLKSHSTSQTDVRKVQDPFPPYVDGYAPGWLEQFREAWYVIPQR